jgi:gliding motility-associated-like protein
VGVGQVVITPNYSTNYNGFPTQPPFTITGCCGEVKIFTDNSTGNSIGANAPINAGSYKLRITFTFGPNNTFFDEQNFTIYKATPTITATGVTTYTYNGTPQGPGTSTYPADATGAVTYSYSGAASDGTVYSASSTKPTNAGSYQVVASIASDVNYNSASSAALNFTIGKATPTLSVTNSPVTYNGSSQSAILSSSVPGSITNAKYNGSATIPTDAATYAMTADFTPTDVVNYNSLTSATAGNFVINKATPTLSVTNSPVTYNGSAQSAVLSSSVPGSITNAKYNGSATIPTNAATYAMTADFTPTDVVNYNSLTSATAGNFVITVLPVFIFEVPNAFTPNGDGLNDELKIISNAGISSLTSFKIFSRSGNLVFESRSLSTGWNGIYKNNLLPADIYYWTAVYVDINNQTKSKTGTVLLLK